ncbi:hypothetical protein D3C76_1548870 [compost metagenome]
MITRLSDDAKFRCLFHKLGSKQSALAIGDDRIEAFQIAGPTERAGEDFNLRVFTQSTNACGMFVGIVNIVKDGDTHFHLPLIIRS